jgi:predicted S18 family serine protease
MKARILAVLLVLSLIANFYLILEQPAPKNLANLTDKVNNLEKTNAELSKQVNMDNVTIQNYASQLDLYRQRISELENKTNNTPSELQGIAELQAPAVTQKVLYTGQYPFGNQQVIVEGSMMNISVEVRPGKGRVLVQTKPLMGVVFQDAANTAVYVAQNITRKDLSGSDVIFSIEAESEVPSVDGPSAGALMTLLVASALDNLTLKKDITLTGTIDMFGHVGAIGGVVEKAKAANDSGKTLFLLPQENSQLVLYTEQTTTYGGITVIEQVPKTVDAKEYIEANVGIKVEYVDNIEDVLKLATA